ncbi:hypothetical protein CMEL01_00418, partial [Colletotrichum melonis]
VHSSAPSSKIPSRSSSGKPGIGLRTRDENQASPSLPCLLVVNSWICWITHQARRQALRITACIPPRLITDVPTRFLHRYPPQFASLPASTRHPSRASISKSPVNRVSAHTGTRPDLACMCPVSQPAEGHSLLPAKHCPAASISGRSKLDKPALTTHLPFPTLRRTAIPSPSISFLLLTATYAYCKLGLTFAD